MNINLRRNEMKKIYTLSALMLLAACGPSIQTTRVNSNQSDRLAATVTDRWVARDTENAVQEFLAQMQTNRTYQRYLERIGDRTPRLFIAEVRNETGEPYFPIGDMNDELLHYFSQSGQFIMVNAAAREKIRQEIEFQGGDYTDPAQAIRLGRATAADLMIVGTVRMQSDTLGAQTVKTYTVNMQLVDIATGEDVLMTRFRTDKHARRSKFGW